MDLAVIGLDGVGIGIIAGAFDQGAAIGVRSIAVGREGGRQRRAVFGGVIENQQEMAALETQELDGGVGVGELGFLSLRSKCVRRCATRRDTRRPSGRPE